MQLDKMTKAQLIEMIGQLGSTETGQTISTLQNERDELKAQVEEQQGMITHLVETNRQLNANKGNALPMVELMDGRIGQINLEAVIYKTKRYTAHELAACPAIATDMVQRGSQAITIQN